MNKSFIITWLPVPVVFLAEHLIMTRYYKKPSSLQRLFATGSDSAKTDLVMWVFYYLLNTHVGTIVSLITLPGIAYFSAEWLSNRVHWYGLLGALEIRSFPLIWAAWLLTLDFSTYVSHVLLHKVPFLWNFHKMHHSATEMTIATGVRQTLSEYFFTLFVGYTITTLILGIPDPNVALAVILAWRVIDLLQHSNLPWDYGVLGYVIASPRYHRLHHSSEVEDHDANYGNIFSMWDYIFGTVGRRYREDSTISDTCALGLHDAEETENMNSEWHSSLLHTTLLPSVFSFLKNRVQKKNAVAEAPIYPEP